MGEQVLRDKAGNVLSTYAVSLPVAAEVLPNGNWLVVSRMKVDEVKPGAPPRRRPIGFAGGRWQTRTADLLRVEQAL